MNTATRPAGAQKIYDHAAKSDTATLLGGLALLDQKATKSQEDRLVYAMVSEVVTDRLSLDAALDEIFMDDDFLGTYYDAITLAIVATGQDQR